MNNKTDLYVKSASPNSAGTLVSTVEPNAVLLMSKKYLLYPIQLRKVVMMPVLMRSTNMAPMIGTIKKGLTE